MDPKVLCVILAILLHGVTASLIASSEIKYCTKRKASYEPMLKNGEPCEKKFLVALAVRSGQGQPNKVFANLGYITNSTGPIKRREQLKRPFRILVYKSPVMANYPLEFRKTINNQPREWSRNVRNKLLGGNSCSVRKHCGSQRDTGFCCRSSSKEKLSKRWEYKRGHGKKEGHYFSHKYSQAVCMAYDPLWYRVFAIDDPYVTYGIKVVVQQHMSIFNMTTKKEEVVWTTVGETTVGPQVRGSRIKDHKQTSSPEVIATWQGDFAGSASLPSLKSKVYMTPTYVGKTPKKKSPQAEVGPEKYLLAPRHMVDYMGSHCRMLGAGTLAFDAQEQRCYRMKNSCFDSWTPGWMYHHSRVMYEKRGRKSPFFPSFYGKLNGLFHEQSNGSKNYLSFDITNKVNHQSLLTLEFVADSVAFIENRSPGRIVETMLEDITELNGGGLLTVIVQNTGSFTADYSVSVDECTEGIVRVAQRTQSLDPRQQGTFEWEMSAGMNSDLDHNCTVVLSDADGNILDTKPIHFKTLENCVYCSDGQCNCTCNAEPENNPNCTSEYLDHFYKPIVVIVYPCYHCWFTDSFRDPYTCTFSVVILLMMVGMMKMLCMFCCCRTSDGRYVDVASMLLGTANQEHTRIKQRSATLQFLLGVCFFVYLPLLPCIIIFCSWRRRSKARARLKKKAARKQERLRAKKQAALLAMKGMMIQENATLDDALKMMEEGQMPDTQAPTLPPRVIVVSSSSDTDNQDFNYTSSSEDMVQLNLDLPLKPTSRAREVSKGLRTSISVKERGREKMGGKGRAKGAAKPPRAPGGVKKKAGKMIKTQGDKQRQLGSGAREQKSKRERKYAEVEQMMKQRHEAPVRSPGRYGKEPKPEKIKKATVGLKMGKSRGKSGGGKYKKSRGGRMKSGGRKKGGSRGKSLKADRHGGKSGGKGKCKTKSSSSSSSASDDKCGSKKHGSSESGESEHHSQSSHREKSGHSEEETHSEEKSRSDDNASKEDQDASNNDSEAKDEERNDSSYVHSDDHSEDHDCEGHTDHSDDYVNHGNGHSDHSEDHDDQSEGHSDHHTDHSDDYVNHGNGHSDHSEDHDDQSEGHSDHSEDQSEGHTDHSDDYVNHGNGHSDHSEDHDDQSGGHTDHSDDHSNHEDDSDDHSIEHDDHSEDYDGNSDDHSDHDDTDDDSDDHSDDHDDDSYDHCDDSDDHSDSHYDESDDHSDDHDDDSHDNSDDHDDHSDDEEHDDDVDHDDDDDDDDHEDDDHDYDFSSSSH